VNEAQFKKCRKKVTEYKGAESLIGLFAGEVKKLE